jgi:hypothetical protein
LKDGTYNIFAAMSFILAILRQREELKMKKAAFIAIIALFMGVMGYLSPKKAPCQDRGVDFAIWAVGPFGLGPNEAANIHIYLTGRSIDSRTEPEDTCKVVINFFDSTGDENTNLRCNMELRRNGITTCGFNPDPTRDERNAYVAIVHNPGPPGHCGILPSGEVYDVETKRTTRALPTEGLDGVWWGERL